MTNDLEQTASVDSASVASRDNNNVLWHFFSHYFSKNQHIKASALVLIFVVGVAIFTILEIYTIATATFGDTEVIKDHPTSLITALR